MSPLFTFIETIVPEISEGISIEALSDSTVIIFSFFSIFCPASTSTSVTSTLSKSPRSGTKIFLFLLNGYAFLERFFAFFNASHRAVVNRTAYAPSITR